MAHHFDQLKNQPTFHNSLDIALNKENPHFEIHFEYSCVIYICNGRKFQIFYGCSIYSSSFCPQIGHSEKSHNPVEVRNASFSWSDDPVKDGCSLYDLTWHVEEGSLVAVVGTVGKQFFKKH